MSTPLRRDLEEFIRKMNQVARSNKSAIDRMEKEVARNCGFDIDSSPRRERIDFGSRKIVYRDFREHVLAQDINQSEPYFLEDRNKRKVFP